MMLRAQAAVLEKRRRAWAARAGGAGAGGAGGGVGLPAGGGVLKGEGTTLRAKAAARPRRLWSWAGDANQPGAGCPPLPVGNPDAPCAPCTTETKMCIREEAYVVVVEIMCEEDWDNGMHSRACLH